MIVVGARKNSRWYLIWTASMYTLNAPGKESRIKALYHACHTTDRRTKKDRRQAGRKGAALKRVDWHVKERKRSRTDGKPIEKVKEKERLRCYMLWLTAVDTAYWQFYFSWLRQSSHRTWKMANGVWNVLKEKWLECSKSSSCWAFWHKNDR